jgi:hypothetical protein
MKTLVAIGLGLASAIGALALLHFKPWRRAPADPRPSLEIGYLPVT